MASMKNIAKVKYVHALWKVYGFKAFSVLWMFLSYLFVKKHEKYFVCSRIIFKGLQSITFILFIWTGYGYNPKYFESRVLSGLYVSLCLKNITILHSLCKRKNVRQAGPDLQFVLVAMSIYDSRLTFLFLVGAEGPAYLSKTEKFSLLLCLIEDGLLLPPGVRVSASTTRCDSL